jgi:DNA-binding NtrC family response regulator
MRRNEKKRILVVDDSQDMLELIRRNLSSKGYQVITGSSVVNAINILEQMAIDLVITDLKMPNINGMELVRHVKENYKNTGILVITGFPTIKGAVETVKLGADEYMLKSFTQDELYDAVKKALEKIDNRQISSEIFEDKTFISSGLIGKSEVMQIIYNEINKASKLKATILLTGETGTGKELVARAIHYSSPQASAPFIPVNCGAIPEDLLESELFGYVKGAFTGANETRGGFFQAADGGTLFLDEISNTSISMQVKLLRVLQEKEVYMIGSNRSQKINLRIITATNVKLSELV